MSDSRGWVWTCQWSVPEKTSYQSFVRNNQTCLPSEKIGLIFFTIVFRMTIARCRVTNEGNMRLSWRFRFISVRSSTNKRQIQHCIEIVDRSRWFAQTEQSLFAVQFFLTSGHIGAWTRSIVNGAANIELKLIVAHRYSVKVLRSKRREIVSVFGQRIVNYAIDAFNNLHGTGSQSIELNRVLSQYFVVIHQVRQVDVVRWLTVKDDTSGQRFIGNWIEASGVKLYGQEQMS